MIAQRRAALAYCAAGSRYHAMFTVCREKGGEFLTEILHSKCERIRIEIYKLKYRRNHPDVIVIGFSIYPGAFLSRRPAKHVGDNTNHALPAAHSSSFISSNISHLGRDGHEIPAALVSPMWSEYL